jgi:RND family efflux transporter MFP subunit
MDMTRKTQLVLIVALFALIAIAWFWISHGSAANSAKGTSADPGGITAAVQRVQRGALEDSLVISGAFKAFQEVDIHAKVSGYIRSISVDVGDRVKEGQTIAVLEIPELAAQLAGAGAAMRRSQEEIHRAESDVERAKSAHNAAHAGYDRLKQASEQRAGLVAQQEVDDSQAKDLESEAQVSSARSALNAARQAYEVAVASQNQYRALATYARIVAPFAGIVTQRLADTGALVAAGTTSSAQSIPIVKLSQVSKLRLVLPIPESMAGQIHLGDPVRVHVQALNKDIVGKVSRFAGELDPQTRTMETEIDFDNRDGILLPGMYAETVLQLSERKDVLTIPLEAVSQNNSGATVLALNSSNVVEERKVQLGLQSKGRAEVLSGLKENELVIVGNRSQFREGEKVIPQEVQLPKMESTTMDLPTMDLPTMDLPKMDLRKMDEKRGAA